MTGCLPPPITLCYSAIVWPESIRRAPVASPRRLNIPGARASAWAYVALGLAEKDKAGASEAIDRAIQEIDRLRESGPGREPATYVAGTGYLYSTNPAAMILPIVERIAPERLADVFWRAVALHSRIEDGPRRPAPALQHRRRVRVARAVRPSGGRRGLRADPYLSPFPRRTNGPRQTKLTPVSSRPWAPSIPGPPFYLWSR